MLSNVLNIRITNLIIIREKYYINAVVYRSELKLSQAVEGFSTAWDKNIFLEMSGGKEPMFTILEICLVVWLLTDSM